MSFRINRRFGRSHDVFDNTSTYPFYPTIFMIYKPLSVRGPALAKKRDPSTDKLGVDLRAGKPFHHLPIQHLPNRQLAPQKPVAAREQGPPRTYSHADASRSSSGAKNLPSRQEGCARSTCAIVEQAKEYKGVTSQRRPWLGDCWPLESKGWGAGHLRVQRRASA